jgi:predicted Zn-dependent peptidase
MIMFGLRGEVLEDQVREPDEVLAGLDAVTAEDVQRVAGELVREQRLNLALIGPFDDEDRFRDVLALSS